MKEEANELVVQGKKRKIKRSIIFRNNRNSYLGT